MMRNMAKARVFLSLVVAAGAVQGCGKLFSSSSEPAGSSSAAPVAAAPAAGGASVVIPAGTLIAGATCDATPRITNEELPGTSVQLGDFSIDTYPYPNDPTKAPVTNVSRDEAAQMCAAAGKRLCTELEWERACKGGSNQEYEYGNTFTAATCAAVAAGSAPGAGSMGSRATCASTFGVHDMHGLVWEWTDSNWGRGTSGGLVATRGGYGPNGELQTRCANGQGRAPLEKAAIVGFRCCSGTKNTADVNITNTKQPALVEEPSVDAALNTRLIAALPKDLRTAPNATVAFEKIFRWHPRPNEEILLARWAAKGASATLFRPMAFKICGNQTHLLAQPRGPVDKAQNPATGADPQKSSTHVGLATNEGDMIFNYVFGRVGIEQPAFVKGNAGVDAGAPASTDAGGAPATVAALTATVDAAAPAPTATPAVATAPAPKPATPASPTVAPVGLPVGAPKPVPPKAAPH
jgi:formylglycine-generating enzyme required for sulfatase activity